MYFIIMMMSLYRACENIYCFAPFKSKDTKNRKKILLRISINKCAHKEDKIANILLLSSIVKYHGLNTLHMLRMKSQRALVLCIKLENTIKNGLTRLYNSYVYSHLIYCVVSWGNASICHLEPQLILHKKRIVRIMTYDLFEL